MMTTRVRTASPDQVHWLWRLAATAGREQSVTWACEQLSLPASTVVRNIAALQTYLDKKHALDPSVPDHFHPVPKNPALLELLKRTKRTGEVPKRHVRVLPVPAAAVLGLDESMPAPSPDEVLSAMTPKGGWTSATLRGWGVPWPPPKGWQRALRQRWERETTPMALKDMR